MRRAGWVFLLWLFVLPGVGGIQQLFAQNVVTLSDNGDSSNRLDLVFLGDGYTSAEMGKFASDVTQFVSLMFAEEPFREYQRYFNIRRIDVASAESGASHPELNPPVFRSTAFDAAYGFAPGICDAPRAICVNFTKVYKALSVLPAQQRAIAIMIVNDLHPGGSSNSGLVVIPTDPDPTVHDRIAHELGHSIGLLADEYGSSPPLACDDSTGPEQVNATKQTVRESIKWGTWIDASTPIPTTTATDGIPGLYAGARYCDTTLYRPTYDSKMRSLGMPFEQINTEQLIRRFYTFTSPIDLVQPSATNISVTQGQLQSFSVNTPSPFSHNLDIKWLVDGIVRGTGATFVFNSSAFSLGAHTVGVQVKDTTAMVRNDPSQLLVGQAKRNLVIISGSAKPIARNDSYTMTQGTVLTVPAPGVLANDTIPPGVTATVEFLTFPPAGLTNLGNGSGGFILDFRPNPTFVGTTAFTYIIHTPQGDSNIATITVQVHP